MLVSFAVNGVRVKRAIVPVISEANDQAMDDTRYLQHCTALLENFSADLSQRTQSLGQEDSLRLLAERFKTLSGHHDALYEEAPALVERLFVTYPDFAPLFPRDLLWFLGGSCLHFLTDDEIRIYQELDTMRSDAAQQGATLDLIEARAKLLKLQ